jgi:hypothetical protein
MDPLDELKALRDNVASSVERVLAAKLIDGATPEVERRMSILREIQTEIDKLERALKPTCDGPGQ